MSKSDLSFVRTEMLPEQAPPVTEQGVVKWLRENLFAGPINTVMTLISLVVIYKILAGITPWLANGVWTTSSLAVCPSPFLSTDPSLGRTRSGPGG